MPSNEEILLAARSILSYLPMLLGPAAEAVKSELEKLLTSAREGAPVENQILYLLARYDQTRVWLKKFLKSSRPPEEVYRLFKPKPLQISAVLRRYANVCLTKSDSHILVPKTHSLAPDTQYAVRLDIGAFSADSVVENAEPFPDEILPRTSTGHWLEVLVVSSEFYVVQRRHVLFLPRFGRSWVCNCTPEKKHICRVNERQPYLFIPIISPSRIQKPRKGGMVSRGGSQLAKLRIAIYYRNNLVQSQLVTAEILQREQIGAGYRSRIDFTLTDRISDVGSLPERTLNILTNENDLTDLLYQVDC